MTSEETTALSAFIKEYDPRFQKVQALDGLTNQAICTRSNGAHKVYFNIPGYVEEARNAIAASPFHNALNKWLAERTIAKVLADTDEWTPTYLRRHKKPGFNLAGGTEIGTGT